MIRMAPKGDQNWLSTIVCLCYSTLLEQLSVLKNTNLLEHFRSLKPPPFEHFRDLKTNLLEHFTILLEHFRAFKFSNRVIATLEKSG